MSATVKVTNPDGTWISGGGGGGSGATAAEINTALKGSAQPVSGTVAVTGPPSAADINTALKATAQPISASALPLPSGAGTAANQALINTGVRGIETTITPAQVAMTAATSTSLLAASASRVRFVIANPTAENLYIRKAASAASATVYDFFIPAGGQYFSDPFEYAGEIRGFSPPGGTVNVSQSV